MHTFHDLFYKPKRAFVHLYPCHSPYHMCCKQVTWCLFCTLWPTLLVTPCQWSPEMFVAGFMFVRWCLCCLVCLPLLVVTVCITSHAEPHHPRTLFLSRRTDEKKWCCATIAEVSTQVKAVTRHVRSTNLEADICSGWFEDYIIYFVFWIKHFFSVWV